MKAEEIIKEYKKRLHDILTHHEVDDIAYVDHVASRAEGMAIIGFIKDLDFLKSNQPKKSEAIKFPSEENINVYIETKFDYSEFGQDVSLESVNWAISEIKEINGLKE